MFVLAFVLGFLYENCNTKYINSTENYITESVWGCLVNASEYHNSKEQMELNLALEMSLSEKSLRCQCELESDKQTLISSISLLLMINFNNENFIMKRRLMTDGCLFCCILILSTSLHCRRLLQAHIPEFSEVCEVCCGLIWSKSARHCPQHCGFLMMRMWFWLLRKRTGKVLFILFNKGDEHALVFFSFYFL